MSYEIVLMCEEHVGADGSEVVEHIWHASNSFDALAFAERLRARGYLPRIRRFEPEFVNYRNFDDQVKRLEILAIKEQ